MLIVIEGNQQMPIEDQKEILNKFSEAQFETPYKTIFLSIGQSAGRRKRVVQKPKDMVKSLI